MSRIVGDEYADVRMSGWVFPADQDDAARQREVLDWLRNITEATSNTVQPTLDNLRGNVVFVGPPGTGKDRLAAWLVKVAVSHGRSVKWFSGADLFAAFRDAMSRDGGETELITSLLQCDYLVLSDPAPPGDNLTGFQIGVLYRIADRRRRAGRPCWLTVNAKNSAEAQARMTPQVWDRFQADAHIVQCFWASYRKPAKVIGRKAAS